MTKSVFGGIVAVVLLGLYVYAVVAAIMVVLCVAQPGCTTATIANFTDGMTLVLTMIGGLVSALVVAELAITPRGNAPEARAVRGDTAIPASRIIKAVTIIYLAVWTLAGVAAFVVGVMRYPEVLQPLTDFGKGWLGVAVAAVYSYFGIKSGQ